MLLLATLTRDIEGKLVDRKTHIILNANFWLERARSDPVKPYVADVYPLRGSRNVETSFLRNGASCLWTERKLKRSWHGMAFLGPRFGVQPFSHPGVVNTKDYKYLYIDAVKQSICRAPQAYIRKPVAKAKKY